MCIRDSNKSFEDAEELFEQMELEIRELTNQSERAKHTTQLQSFKVIMNAISAFIVALNL